MESQPNTVCPKCGGRLFFEERRPLEEPEWTCINCGYRVAMTIVEPLPHRFHGPAMRSLGISLN
jgi:DNA-directed RNA polymerase subunit RPC12/RpoP